MDCKIKIEETPLQTDESSSSKQLEPPPPEEPPKIPFNCYNCNLNELCEYKGTNPPFADKIKLTEECYVMKDPFSAAPSRHSKTTSSEYFIILGANCSRCDRMVCKAVECSIFYAKTYCLNCANSVSKEFPVEVQTRVKKQLA